MYSIYCLIMMNNFLLINLCIENGAGTTGTGRPHSPCQQNKADEDYIRFQLEQLEEANLSAGEQEELEQETDMLSHAEEIKAGCSVSDNC